jgi:glucose/arabinose dehydrogenase
VATAVAAGLVLAFAAFGCGSDDGERSRPPTAATAPSGSAGEDSPADSSRAPTADDARRGVRLVRVGSFDSPLYVTAPPGDTRRTFVVEQGGKIWVLQGGKRLARPFLDISELVTSGGEEGLLSLAFAPDYARSGRFYVYFTDRNGDNRVQEIRRSQGDPNRADPGTRRQVLLLRHPQNSNHNGGLVLFGPDDLLYIGTGDGGGGGDAPNNAQRLSVLLGKVLRIDPRASGDRAYSVPRSNPFVGRSGRDEIYSYGLRNPWRFSFDKRTGNIFIGDVGEGSREEIDFARRGAARGRNFGWSCFEGKRRYDTSRSCSGAVAPLLDIGRSHGECSVTGGVVVRDPALPALAGRYVYGDYCRGLLFSLRVSGGRAVDVGSLDKRVSELSSFGEDARGRVYVTSLGGSVYRLAAR